MVHCFTWEGTHIVVDVYSGAVHIMEDAAYALTEYYAANGWEDAPPGAAVVTQLKAYAPEQLAEAYGELKELVEEGLLFTPDAYAEIAKHYQNQPVVKALCIHIAHDCNLRCAYCFADEGAFGGTRELMPEEVGKAAIDFVIAYSGRRRNIEIDFFGGEPLMNFSVVKSTVAYARSREQETGKRFRFTITTNGMLLTDEIMDYINENMVNVVLSIDGRKEVNDRVRCRVDGSGSYDTIVPKFQKLAESRGQDNYYVRGTFTRHNLDFAKDVLHLADLGFKQTSVEPVVAPFTADYALQYEDIPKIYEQYDILAKEYIRRRKEGKGFNFFHFMVDLDQGPCVYKRLSGCGSGSEYLAVAPGGDIYPCHQFVGNKAFRMGNVLNQEEPFRRDISETFAGCNVYSKPACRDCWAKFYCSGGCPANAQQFNGDLNKPYDLGCELQRKRIECAIAIKAALTEDTSEMEE